MLPGIGGSQIGETVAWKERLGLLRFSWQQTMPVTFHLPLYKEVNVNDTHIWGVQLSIRHLERL
jgi:hypothetical protein